MKVVLFCGGQGTRIRDYSDEIPKPLIPLGNRPILWHIMKYYAHFGHTDFILCLGYKATAIKRYFLEYDEAISNDFELRRGGKEVKLYGSDIDDWNITFVDTGHDTPIGERLRRVREHIGEDELFLANYSDGVGDLDLDAYVAGFERTRAIAGLVAIRPPQSFHVLRLDGSRLAAIEPMRDSGIRLNGGFFVLRREIFEHMRPGEDLVEEPFRRLVARGAVHVHEHDGFFAPMDTFKDKMALERLCETGAAPWMLWHRDALARAA